MTRMGLAFQRCVAEPIPPGASLRNRFIIRAIRVLRGFPFVSAAQTSGAV